MTSCVFSLFFLVSLFSSITATNPTGLKVRITDRAQDVLKDVGLTYMKELVDKPTDFQWENRFLSCRIKGFTLTHLDVDPAQVVVRFQRSGLQFEISNLNFGVKLQANVKMLLSVEKNMIFEGGNLSTVIGLSLNRTQQGRLNVELLDCKVGAEAISTRTSGITGSILDFFISVSHQYFIQKFCPAVQRHIVPKVNTVLGNLSMVKKVFENPDLSVDYSLSEDISVDQHSIDASFKCLVFGQGGAVNTPSLRTGTNPVFRGSDRMVYVGLSEFIFNSIGMSLYNSGPFNTTIPKINPIANVFLNALSLSEGTVRVELTEAPTVNISQDGFSIKVAAKAQSLTEPSPKPLSVVCQVNVKVDIRENRLVLLSKKINCGTEKMVGKILIKIADMLLTIIKRFSKGILMSPYEGVDFTWGKINFYNGFMVVEGDLNLTPQGMKKVVEKIGR